MSWNKTHSKALEEKVARIKNANNKIREELKQRDKKIAELEALQSRNCYLCKGFVRDDYCSIIDDDCRVVMERCNGCRQFIPKEK